MRLLILALLALASGYFGVYFAPGLLLMRAFGWRVDNPVGNAIAAFVLSLFGVSLAWIGAQAVTDGIAGRTCLYLTIACLDAAALLAAVFLARGAPALPTLPDQQHDRRFDTSKDRQFADEFELFLLQHATLPDCLH